jgi:xanthine dehydrogenase YagR molybdenum-binding subunit
MPNSPLANLSVGDVVLVDGKLASRNDASRAVSITDVMRHGGMDCINQSSQPTPQDHSQAHNTHSAVFAEVKWTSRSA